MIKSNDLLSMLREKFDKNEITQDDIDQIEDLTLKKYKIDGTPKDIDLTELGLFKHLKTLMLSRFEIDDEDMQAINENADLWAVQFSSCEFQSAAPINQSVKYVIFDHCKNVSGKMINNNETTKIIGAELDLKQVEKLSEIERLYLQNCKVANIEELARCGKLKYLNLDGSSTNNRRFLDSLDEGIEVSYNDEFFLADAER